MRYILVYGAIAGAIVIGIMCLIFVTRLPIGHSLWFGYLVMLVGLSMIFVGIKRYRDVEKGGVVRFLPAFGLGLGMAVMAGLLYVIGWEAYLAASFAQPSDFIANMAEAGVRDMRAAGASAAEIAGMQAEMDGFIAMYRNPLARFAITFVEIFPIGFIVALASAAILRNPRVLPAHQPA